MEIVVRIPKTLFRFRSKHVFVKRKQGFRFDMGTWCYMSSYLQLDFDDMGKIGDRFIDVVYYCAAYRYNEHHKGVESIKFTEDDVKLWFKWMPQIIANRIMKVMLDSRIGGQTLGESIAEGITSKKK